MASLQSQYQRAIASPGSGAFASQAAVHYVPTLTSIRGEAAIGKHLQAQETQYKVKHNFLNVVESDQALCVEAETTLHFLEGSGPYLPGLDENFVFDRVATLPTIHMVSFDADQKISQVRIFWDQAALLKAVEVIGARAKNWPIQDGKDQSRLISSSVAGQQPASEIDTRRQSRVGANGDKHTSLNLFERPMAPPREESPVHRDVVPRASAKPAPRDYHDLFAAGAEQLPADNRPASPIKEYRNAIKSGAGKHYQPQRLFGEEEEEEQLKSPEKGIKTNPRKYEHFEFGERPFDPSEMPKPKHGKHLSQWSFEDFVTPQKPRGNRPGSFHQSQRHFGWSDDEEEAAKPNKFRNPHPAPRPDAQPQFELKDEQEAKAEATSVPIRGGGGKGLAHERSKSLYNDEVTQGQAQEPLGNITNRAAHVGHNKTFSSNFDIRDDSNADEQAFRSSKENAGVAAHEAAKKKPEAAARVPKALETHWSIGEGSPKGQGRGIKIAGDGMGSRKTGEKSWWEYDEQ